MPKRFAVIGDPIAHSLSPAMQAAALRSAGVEGEYVAELVTADTLRGWIVQMPRHLDGANVTIPHKRAVATLADRLHPEARAVGAVNTLVVERGVLAGYNTDVPGFARALARLTSDPQRAVIFGAGGSARAVVRALRGVALTVVARRPETVEALRDLAPDLVAASPDSPAAFRAVAAADVLINTTPLGMAGYPDESPLPAGAELRPGAAVMDLVYGRVTPFLHDAARQGCRTMDGLEMLVQQGAESFRLWLGTEPDLEAMREACRLELERRECCVF